MCPAKALGRCPHWLSRWPAGHLSPLCTEGETRAGRAQVGGPGGESPLLKPKPGCQGKKIRARARGKGCPGGNPAHCQLGWASVCPDRSGSPSVYLTVRTPTPQGSGDFDSESPGTHPSGWPTDLRVVSICRNAPSPDPLPRNLHLNTTNPRLPQGHTRTAPFVVCVWQDGIEGTSQSGCIFEGPPPPFGTPTSGSRHPPATPMPSPEPSPVKPLAWVGPTALSRASRASPTVWSMSPEQSHKGVRPRGLEKGPFCSQCCWRRRWLQRLCSEGTVPYACSFTPAPARPCPWGARVARPILAAAR